MGIYDKPEILEELRKKYAATAARELPAIDSQWKMAFMILLRMVLRALLTTIVLALGYMGFWLIRDTYVYIRIFN